MAKNKKRKLDLVVISDVHLGTYGCQADELLHYLKSIKPKTLVLNGDIIDIWQFSKRYWPAAHMKVVKQITAMLSKGTNVIYIPGNHDEMLRKFVGFKLGKFQITNKLVLKLDDGRTCWIFHGDVFDVTMQYSKWLAKLGAVGYDTLILINAFVNFISTRLGKGKISLSKKIKNSVKGAVKYINDFEKTAAEIAISNGFHYVICGHIHHPEMRQIVTEKGEVTYLNSGDWVENLTALEFDKGEWNIYKQEVGTALLAKIDMHEDHIPNNKELFKAIQAEFFTTLKVS
jgi:UDP-2,3-diacylglucosamine pyrophosphatase LpxH